MRKHDHFDYRSVYRLSVCASAINALSPAVTPQWFVYSPLFATYAAPTAAFDYIHRLFDKRRPQLVAVWFNQTAANALDKVVQRTYKYDHMRRKYISR